ncbi:hypothetical protein M8818_000346 [Zalaria obscura]|uniref:Uncharacterized protein n=1 Tax=Zalaria obscura TaxID=2024903 RepID=A0ACC3SNU4_9PEZI
MVAVTLLAPVLLGCLAAAKTCTNVTVPVTIMARQGMFEVPTLQSNFDATTFALNFTTQGTNFTNASLTGYQTVNLPANISAKYCKPDNDSSASPTVQVLSHGIGFDKSYWDLPYNDYNYSYIDVALAHGFHTVSIDRFGIGNSSHGDPLNVVQAPAEVSALYDITMMLRSGDFPSVSTAFNKVVHVGHSFGSAQTYLLSAMHPNATDGIALTGFSMNATWLPQTLADWNLHLARLNQPLRFGNQTVSRSSRWTALFFNTAPVQLLQSVLQSIGIQLSPYQVWEEIATTELGDLINQWNATVAPIAQNVPTGYLTWSDFTSNIFAFLHPGMFDIGLGIFSEMTKQPVTLGEIFTLANGAPMINPFTGPVQVVTGQRDAIYCGGDCLNTGGVAASIPAMVKSNFPDASVFETVIQPNTGHGINLHYNSTGAYEAIQTFFTSNNLGGY